MKLITLIVFSLVNFSAFASGVTELFSPSERNQVIRTIDNTCGDSWCEGDYNFKFVNFSCDKFKKACDLSFHFIKSDEQEKQIYSPIQVCHFKNIKNLSQIKDGDFSLNQNFYDELTECISNRESEVQF